MAEKCRSLQISTVEMEWNASYANYAECDDREGGKCIFGDGVGIAVGETVVLLTSPLHPY